MVGAIKIDARPSNYHTSVLCINLVLAQLQVGKNTCHKKQLMVGFKWSRAFSPAHKKQLMGLLHISKVDLACENDFPVHILLLPKLLVHPTALSSTRYARLACNSRI